MAANCASCLWAGLNTGADAAFCFRDSGEYHVAQMGYSRRSIANLATGETGGDAYRVCDSKTLWYFRDSCRPRHTQAAWVNLARPDDDSWVTGEYWSRWEFADVQEQLSAIEATGKDCTKGGCIYDVHDDTPGIWSFLPKRPSWVNASKLAFDQEAGVLGYGSYRGGFSPRPVPVKWRDYANDGTDPEVMNRPQGSNPL